MSHADLQISRFVERQMRNWELARQQDAARAAAKPPQGIHFYIAISRELGSGGAQVAECLSQCLGWPKYDREILEYMSEKEEVRRQVYEMLDERQRTWLQQLIDLLEPMGIEASRTREEYFRRLTRSVLAIAEHESAIFVGRGVNFVLPRSRGLSVRIVSPLKNRVTCIMRREKLDERSARRRIREVESQRAEFLVRYFGGRPYDPRRYDLILNAGTIDIEQMCCLIRSAAEHKGRTALACCRSPVGAPG